MLTDNLAIDIRQLQHFLTIIDCGSLGRASKKLNISEPALSKSIRRMEERLQVLLLDRSRRGVVPTVYMPKRVIEYSASMGDFVLLDVPEFIWIPRTLILRRRGATLSPTALVHLNLLKEALQKGETK